VEDYILNLDGLQYKLISGSCYIMSWGSQSLGGINMDSLSWFLLTVAILVIIGGLWVKKNS
jgi:hypothetical protein